MKPHTLERLEFDPSIMAGVASLGEIKASLKRIGATLEHSEDERTTIVSFIGNMKANLKRLEAERTELQCQIVEVETKETSAEARAIEAETMAQRCSPKKRLNSSLVIILVFEGPSEGKKARANIHDEILPTIHFL